mmetsp:Transcript_4145/g.9281  ORF Transcript_4145/g.9281 Transcript_4145/m.9281 type:complete len:220 (+) Transcript_4145:1105-1764(+)
MQRLAQQDYPLDPPRQGLHHCGVRVAPEAQAYPHEDRGRHLPHPVHLLFPGGGMQHAQGPQPSVRLLPRSARYRLHFPGRHRYLHPRHAGLHSLHGHLGTVPGQDRRRYGAGTLPHHPRVSLLQRPNERPSGRAFGLLLPGMDGRERHQRGRLAVQQCPRPIPERDCRQRNPDDIYLPRNIHALVFFRLLPAPVRGNYQVNLWHDLPHTADVRAVLVSH